MFRHVCFIMVSSMVMKAAAVHSAVESGDFFVVTERQISLKSFGMGPGEGLRLSVISPTGSLRASLLLPGSGTSADTPFKEVDVHRTSISPDGKFAFTTASAYRPSPKGVMVKTRIYVTRLRGSIPKVVQTLAVPTSKNCTWDISNKIAVDGPSRNGNYGIYVSHNCFDGCKNKFDASSFEVVKLRYNPSTGKLALNVKKPYKSSRFPCGSMRNSGMYYKFAALQVSEGKPYGLMTDKLKGLKLTRLGSADTLASLSAAFEDCDPDSFVIASPNQFYGLCGDYRVGRSPIFVQGSKITTAFPTSDEEYFEVTEQLRFSWMGSVASKPLLRTSYAILHDGANGRNNTLYEFAQKTFGKPPVAIAKLDTTVLSPNGLPIAEGGNIVFRQLLVIP